ncbi:hypothetical protein Hanom_Chr02g00159401 [Helianthus anomalus]
MYHIWIIKLVYLIIQHQNSKIEVESPFLDEFEIPDPIYVTSETLWDEDFGMCNHMMLDVTSSSILKVDDYFQDITGDFPPADVLMTGCL